MLTTNKKDLQKFSESINVHMKKIIELQAEYKVLEILNDLNKAKFDAAYKQVFTVWVVYGNWKIRRIMIIMTVVNLIIKH